MISKFNSFSPFFQVIVLLLIGICSYGILSMLLVSIFSSIYPEISAQNVEQLIAEKGVIFMLLFYLPFQLGLFLVPGYFFARAVPDSSLTSVSNFTNWIWAGLFFTGLLFLTPVLTAINELIIRNIGLYEQMISTKLESEELFNSLFGITADTYSFICALLIIGIITPIAEEFAFRGVLLRHLIIHTNKKILAIITSGLFFAILHFNYLQLIPLIAFGIGLGLIYVVTKSIWPGIVLHAFNNCLNIFWVHNDNTPKWMNEVNYYIVLIAMLAIVSIIILFRKKIIEKLN